MRNSAAKSHGRGYALVLAGGIAIALMTSGCSSSPAAESDASPVPQATSAYGPPYGDSGASSYDYGSGSGNDYGEGSASDYVAPYGTDDEEGQASGSVDCADVGHPIEIVGEDQYNLDADGDGVGCEWSREDVQSQYPDPLETGAAADDPAVDYGDQLDDYDNEPYVPR